MRRRAGIEATISELVRSYGLRRARYRGLAKMRLQSCFSGTACNINRWIRRLAEPAGAFTKQVLAIFNPNPTGAQRLLFRIDPPCRVENILFLKTATFAAESKVSSVPYLVRALASL
jgi:hypothetical protein